MIRNVIFDMGAVLLDYDPAVFIRHFGIEGEDMRLLQEKLYASWEWAMMDWGYMTEEETIERITPCLPERLQSAVPPLVKQWDRICPMVEGMLPLLAELKEKGYHLYLLSNAGPRHKEYWPQLPTAPYFEGKVISAEEHLVKPQPEIYRVLLERYALRPEECVFIDDVPLNVAGAARCGIPGIVFRGAVPLRRELRAVGVNVEE